MTDHRPLSQILSLILCVFMFAPALFAEEEEEEVPYPTRPEALAFLKERIPLAITLLERVRKQEGEREYQDALAEAVEHVFEYREFLHHDGKAVADLHIEGVAIELEIVQQIDRFHDEADTPEEREAARTALKSMVERQLEHEKKIKALELQEVLGVIEELKRELAELNAISGEAIDREVRGLLDEEEDPEEDE